VLSVTPLLAGTDTTLLHRSPAALQPPVATDRPRQDAAAPDLRAVRLAHLTPSVIFADSNILSYRTESPDDGLSGLRTSVAFVPSPGWHPRTAFAAADACPADDIAGATEVTITLFLTADSSASHVAGEYTLWRQVNDSAPVAIVRHVLHDGRQPFLAYRYILATSAGTDSLATVPRSMLPISRRDTVAAAVDVRTLRAVEWHFLVPFDSATHTPRIARVHLVTSLPPVDQLDRHECRAVLNDPPRLAIRSDGPTPNAMDWWRPARREWVARRQSRLSLS